MLRSVLDGLGSSLPRDETLAAVEIRTDAYGVSHLEADDRYGLSYALGYVQARDRLFEMDVLRHIGYGDSASVLGPGQLASDIQVRRELYSREEIRNQYESADPVAREALDGFAAGVNRRLLEMVTSGSIPAEFVALGHRPELWKPADSIAVMDYLIGFFGVFGGRELESARLYSRLVDTLGSREAAYEALGDLEWLRLPEDHYTSIPRDEGTVDGGEDVLSFEAVPDRQLELADLAGEAEPWGIRTDLSLPRAVTDGIRQATGVLAGFKWGSNALVVDGAHTETGASMMFGGPQMGYFKPPVIYEVGLHGAGYDVRGVVPVGTPGVVIGRTPAFAWSVTSGRDDMVDTIAVDLHPEDRHRYRWGDEWHEMRTETVTHRTSIPGALLDGDLTVEYVEQEVARVVEDGETMPVVAWNEAERVAWIQRSAVRGQELDAAFRWANLGRQDGLEGVKRQLREFPFAFNFLYADADTVAFLHTATVPDRNPDLDARLPAPARDHYWRGTRVGLGIGAHATDPDQGYFLNWNNAPIGDYRSGEGPCVWGSVNRAELLDRAFHRVLEASDGALSIEDVADVLEYAATHDAVARYTVPRMVDVARDRGLTGMADELDRWAAADYPWRATDGRYDDPGHAIWDATRRRLQTIAFRDELGDLTPALQLEPPRDVDPEADDDPHAGDHGRTRREVTLVDALEGRTAHDWLGEDPDEAVARALRQAREDLTEAFGTADPTEWRLEEHTSKFRSLGAGEPVDVPMVNRGSWNQVVALGPDGDARGVLPPSNTGHLPLGALPAIASGDEPAALSDQLDLYRAFEFKPLPVTNAEVAAATEPDGRLRVRRSRVLGPLLDATVAGHPDSPSKGRSGETEPPPRRSR